MAEKMNRRDAREAAVQLAYAYGFTDCSVEEFLDRQLTRENFAALAEETDVYAAYPSEQEMRYLRTVLTGVAEHGYELDCDIDRYAKGWKFSRIPRVAAAILRVAMFEILYMPDIPNAAAVNEAVEIAKHYEDDKVVSFINGILGSFVRAECGDGT